MNKLQEVASKFAIPAEVVEIRPLGDGLINDTYYIETEAGKPDYVLQRINHNVFTNVDLLQDNIDKVTKHIRRKLEKAGEKDLDRKVLSLVPLKNSEKTYFFDGESYWRVTRFIEDSKTLKEVTPETARTAGEAFGNFQSMLVDIDSELGETIPDFHTMSFRLRQLREAVEADAAGRKEKVADLVAELERRAEKMCEPEKLFAEGKLPKRICHCDTKVNNMLFDKEGNVLCVIDLDTVMPSFIFSDYGDFLRTGACTTPEDEPETSKIDFDLSIFRAFTEGYLKSAGNFLTPVEEEWLPMAAAMFPYMQAVRFLADYLNGDTYFKVQYPEHNLVRTKAQIRLLEQVEAKLPEMAAIVAELRAK